MKLLDFKNLTYKVPLWLRFDRKLERISEEGCNLSKILWKEFNLKLIWRIRNGEYCTCALRRDLNWKTDFLIHRINARFTRNETYFLTNNHPPTVSPILKTMNLLLGLRLDAPFFALPVPNPQQIHL